MLVFYLSVSLLSAAVAKGFILDLISDTASSSLLSSNSSFSSPPLLSIIVVAAIAVGAARAVVIAAGFLFYVLVANYTALLFASELLVYLHYSLYFLSSVVEVSPL